MYIFILHHSKMFHPNPTHLYTHQALPLSALAKSNPEQWGSAVFHKAARGSRNHIPDEHQSSCFLRHIEGKAVITARYTSFTPAEWFSVPRQHKDPVPWLMLGASWKESYLYDSLFFLGMSIPVSVCSIVCTCFSSPECWH